MPCYFSFPVNIVVMDSTYVQLSDTYQP